MPLYIFLKVYKKYIYLFSVHIANNCRGRTSYRLEEVTLVKRSVDPEKKYQFIEFGGKSFIKYNIVNINDL